MSSEAAFEHSPGYQAAQRLHDLGLDAELLATAIAKGVDARKRCTPFHPPSYPGFVQWGETHVGLREALTPRGWRADDTGGFSTVVNPDGDAAITVATGSDRTGQRGLPFPTTKYPRGPMTHSAIERNQLALILFGPRAGELAEPENFESRMTWILLVATRHDEIRAELSLPRTIDDAGRVSLWSERILLPALGIEPTIPFDDNEGDDDFEVPVERR